MGLSERYNKSCLNSAPTNKSPAEAEPEPEIEPEPSLASNSFKIPALGEVYVPISNRFRIIIMFEIRKYLILIQQFLIQ